MRRLPATFARATDTGPTRGVNEDWAAAMQTRPSPSSRESLLIGAVADGMGGHAAGEVAGRLAVNTFVQTVISAYSGSARTMFDPAAATEHGFRRANSQVVERARSDSRNHGMGTTLTTAVVHDGKVYVGHVGDSRALLVRRGRARVLTRDHTIVQEKLAAGVITEQEAATSGERNRLTRALGVKESLVPDIVYEDVRDGDVIVLTTDGIHSSVHEREIATTVASMPDAESVCRRLVALARARDGSDNMTAVCLSLGGARAATVPQPRTRRRRRASAAAVGIATAIVLLVVAVLVAGRGGPAPTTRTAAKGSTRSAVEAEPAVSVHLTLAVRNGKVLVSDWKASSGLKLWVDGHALASGQSVPIARLHPAAPDQAVQFSLDGKRGWQLRRPEGKGPEDKKRGVSIDGGPFDLGSGRSVTGSTGVGVPKQRVRFYLSGGPGGDIPVEITLGVVKPVAAGKAKTSTGSARHNSPGAKPARHGTAPVRPSSARQKSGSCSGPTDTQLRDEPADQATPEPESGTQSPAAAEQAPARQAASTTGCGDAASGEATGDTAQQGQSDSGAQPPAPKRPAAAVVRIGMTRS